MYFVIGVLTCLTFFFGLVSFGIINFPWNLEETKFYGEIKSWDSNTGNLILTRSDSTEQLFVIDPKLQKVLWVNVNDQKIELARQTLTSKGDPSWENFFCVGENVLATAKRKLSQKTFVLSEVLNIGKRTCQ